MFIKLSLIKASTECQDHSLIQYMHTCILHYFDSKTRLNVMTDREGYLIGGWKLSKDQIKHLISNGNVQ